MAIPVIWITGFSGAGKTTVAKALCALLREKGVQPVWLDGDRMRAVLDQTTQFKREERIRLGLTYARLAKELNGQGFCVVVSTISMFREVFDWNRANMPAYFEVFLDVNEDVRKGRDPKGIYKEHPESMARQNIINDKPEKADLVVNNDGSRLPAAVAEDIYRATLGRHVSN